MRFFSAIVAALPTLAAAQGETVPQYQAQFQNFLSTLGGYIPNPGRHDPIAALEAKTGALKLHTLTLNNWRDTLYETVSPTTKTPEEWWVLVSGRNKTCFGHCNKVEQAFNETAGKFALDPTSPYMGYINCDDQPILCNVWSASPGTLWILEMLPPPAAINIYTKRLNLSSTTSEDVIAYRKAGGREKMNLLDSWFHPFQGMMQENGLAVPIAYVLWFFSAIPNWAFMLGVSFLSRTMMGNRMRNMQDRPEQRGAQAPAAAAAGGAR